MGKQAAGTATAERQTDGTPQGIYGENTVTIREFSEPQYYVSLKIPQ